MELRSLSELVETEAAYCNELAVLCDLKMSLARHCDAPTVDGIFANIEALRGINAELLAVLKGEDAPPESDALDRVATAFETLAPYLRAYALFCTQAITAQERVVNLRATNASAEIVMAEVEASTGLPIGSLVIKPVQRLCKYPLLLASLLAEAGATHDGLVHAVHLIESVVSDVNERVRSAEEREAFLVLAEALGRRDLVKPQRSLMLSVVADRWIETHPSAAIGIEAEVQRLLRLEPERSAGRSQHRAAVWLTSDLLLLGRPKGASYSLVEQSTVLHTTIEAVASGVVRLACETGAIYLLSLPPADAQALVDGLQSAHERVAQGQRARARGALCALEVRKVGHRRAADGGSGGAARSDDVTPRTASVNALLQLKARRRASFTSASALPKTAPEAADERQPAAMTGSATPPPSKRGVHPIGPHGSWALRLRMRLSAAARELSAGSFGRRSRKRPGSLVAAGEGSRSYSGFTAHLAGDASGDEQAADESTDRAEEGGRTSKSQRLSGFGDAGATLERSRPLVGAKGGGKGRAAGLEGAACEATADAMRAVSLSTPPSASPPHTRSSSQVDAGCSTAAAPHRPPALRELIRTAEASGEAFHEELLLALRRRAALSPLSSLSS